MKDLRVFLEGKTIEEVIVKDIKTNKEVDVVYYCYDKESLDDIVFNKYKNVGKYWIDKGFFLAKLKNKSTWTINTDEEWNIHTWRPNGDFIERNENEEEYTYDELLELLDKGETMLVVINK